MLARILTGFVLGVALWFGFRELYERTLAASAQAVLSAFERPRITTLTAVKGEILVDRTDFPRDSPRPGLPADDIHFNAVILAALFALQPGFFRGESLMRLLAALALLFLVHVAAVVAQVESVYATRLGEWSAVHYGPVARNLWAGGFHFYLVAGRFAAPFVLWWLLAVRDLSGSRGSGRPRGKTKARSARP
jgi:hypothetical protein